MTDTSTLDDRDAVVDGEGDDGNSSNQDRKKKRKRKKKKERKERSEQKSRKKAKKEKGIDQAPRRYKVMDFEGYVAPYEAPRKGGFGIVCALLMDTFNLKVEGPVGKPQPSDKAKQLASYVEAIANKHGLQCYRRTEYEIYTRPKEKESVLPYRLVFHFQLEAGQVVGDYFEKPKKPNSSKNVTELQYALPQSPAQQISSGLFSVVTRPPLQDSHWASYMETLFSMHRNFGQWIIVPLNFSFHIIGNVDDDRIAALSHLERLQQFDQELQITTSLAVQGSLRFQSMSEEHDLDLELITDSMSEEHDLDLMFS
eukprot:g78080.t1